MPEFLIANRMVGDDQPPLVIAEIGINHEGSFAVAKEMVRCAKEAGAEIVKHQTHVVEDEMAPTAKHVLPGNAKVSIFEIMESCALSLEEEADLKKYAESLGLIYISTPFSRAAAAFLGELDVPAFKIGSGECNNYPLIEFICRFGKPLIISTGMNSVQSIRPAVDICRANRVPYALLHCTNLYPTPHRLVRYGGMLTLKEAFPDAVVGLSDHTVSNNACLGAVALGAAILERHFTDSKERSGPDIVCSMDGLELKALIEGSREIFECRGGSKEPAPEEAVTMNFAFSTVVSIRDIQPGEVFTRDNLWVKRPGIGDIPAAEFESVLGRKASRPIAKDSHLSREDIHK